MRRQVEGVIYEVTTTLQSPQRALGLRPGQGCLGPGSVPWALGLGSKPWALAGRALGPLGL